MKRSLVLQFICLFAAFNLAQAAAHPRRAAPATPTPHPTLPMDAQLSKWCREVQASVKGFRWNVDSCKGLAWKMGGKSVLGRPLVYEEFGNPNAKNVTLVFAAVHGDEVTPVYLGLKLAHWLRDREPTLKDTRVIVAPLVNPDGYFHRPRHRTNAHGVDVNRNFATRDWEASALRSWAIKYHKNPRRYPGNEPRSEPETIFQEDMIRTFKPQKIISIHSPLNFLDYDGPSPAALTLDKFPKDYVQQCLELRKRVKAISSGFFPGSLGNYAGQELGIPTLTLELPTANPKMAETYWRKFSQGIRVAIEFVVDPHAAGGM